MPSRSGTTGRMRILTISGRGRVLRTGRPRCDTGKAHASLNGRLIQWRTIPTGFRQLHLIVKLADGTWLISDESTGASRDWRESELLIADLHWRKLDIENILKA